MATPAHPGSPLFSSTQTPVKSLSAPIASDRHLSTREKLILLNGSKLHGCKFWPWDKAPLATEFEALESGSLYEDPTEFYFSAEQQKILDGWRRLDWMSRPAADEETAEQMEKVDLVQDITSDCSVVASLCAETARTERLRGPSRDESVLSAIMYPQNGVSESGKYVFKLNFNGCPRRVEIDDRLPASKTSRALHVVDRSKSNLLWPALVEKAYLKVRGGYDFPGSNSGTDLWVLTGWIPEQLFFQSDDILPNAFWKRIYNAFNYGDALITIGTGKLSYKEEQVLGLASEHAYAIVNMKEQDGQRSFLIKNPWSEGGVWTGSSTHSADTDDNHTHPPEVMMPGTFWMDLNNVFQHFETIYLNWNPGLFSHRRDAHFTWDLASRSAYGSFSMNPQYLLRSKSASTVWLLLTKHFQNFSREHEDSDVIDLRLQTGFLSLYTFEKEHRVFLTDGASLKVPYVDAPNVLLRFEVPPNSTYVIVASEQNMPSSKLDFTLSAFSTQPLMDFRPAATEYSYCVVQQSAWTRTTAGGNGNSSHFHLNPQFRLDCPTGSDIAIGLEADNCNFAVHVKLVWTGGKRVPAKITNRDIYGDSGEYRRGCAIAEIPRVLAGRYAVICSTFKPGQLGNFTLKVWSTSDQCSLNPLSIADPGMFTLPLTPAAFHQGIDRVLAPLQVSRLMRFSVSAENIAAETTSSLSSPLKVSLEYGQGPNTITLASTGDYADVAGSVRTPEIDLKPITCDAKGPGVWLVIERMEGSSLVFPEEIEVKIISDEQGVEVGLWGKAADEPIEELRRRLAASSMH